MRRSAARLGSLAAIILPACVLGRASAPGPDPGAAQPGSGANGPLKVVFSGEALGYLAPCGCTSPMIGGFPRRGTYVAAAARRSPLVLVENGDLTEAAGRQDELKAETLVEMLAGLKYDALNLGEKDFLLGAAYLQALDARLKGAVLSANVRAADGSAVFREQVLVERKVGGRPVRIRVAGVLSEQFRPLVTAVNPELSVEPAASALERLQPVLADADVRVLLFHGPHAEAQTLADRFPGFQLIVYAHEGDQPVEPERRGRALLVSGGQAGKHLGWARLSSDGGWRAVEAGDAPLGPDLADDPAMKRAKAAYLDRVAAEDLLGKLPRVATASGDTYAGSAACAGCHAAAHRAWETSGHARALNALASAGEDRDPECLACHVTGLAHTGGFAGRDRSPALAGVGCEACHGAASRHAADPKTPMPKVAPSDCVVCHNTQNSPRFDYDAYWPRVKH